MSLRVLYFARSRELTRKTEEEITLAEIDKYTQTVAQQPETKSVADANSAGSPSPPSTTASPSQLKVVLSQLMPYLLHLHPELSQLPLTSLLLAVNHEMMSTEDGTVELRPNDEIALIQPISGG